MRRTLTSLGWLALATLAVTEVTLRVAANLSREAESVLLAAAPRLLADETFGYVGNPTFPGHDREGNRNAVLHDRASIVALGDSQTYGTGVEPEQAWPAQLGALRRDSVYSLAIPGYGPTHQLLLGTAALARRPRTVVATLYTGNDAYDCAVTVHRRGQLSRLRAGASLSAGQLDDLDARIEAAFADAVGRSEVPQSRLRSWLARHSRTYGLWRSLRRGEPVRTTFDQHAARAATSGGTRVADSGSGWRTVFTPAYRTLALDPLDPCIAEGRRLALAALEELAVEVSAAGAELLVLLIPTKELVHAEVAAPLTPGHARLAALEAAWLAELHGALGTRSDVRVVNGLAALRGVLATGQAPYPEDHDGHPNAAGHAALAAAVDAALR